MRTLAAVTLAAALFWTGCSSNPDDDSRTRSTEPTSGEASRSATDATTVPPMVSARDAQRLTFADRGATVWRRGGDPDSIVSAFGSIWVQFADGKVQRINPANGQVIASIETGYSAIPSCDMLSADDHVIWTCAGPNSLLPIDPRTNAAGTLVRGSILGDQLHLPWSARMLWTIRGNGKTLDGRGADGSVLTSVNLGAFCTDLAGSQSVHVAVRPTDAKVAFVDPARATVVGDVPLDDPRRAAVADFAWVGSAVALPRSTWRPSRFSRCTR